ncbi:site-specific integrase [Xanthomonas euvesicatoria pv. physalidis]|uniref:tyrosine-type recombinase/integrase n=1 Tax=Xanthomonas euvesicatoria TaxID=456327 RepID=UPI001C47FF14|nr:tyrosine-type recombinase/integrase [Xanthomonas euvesicatoria]MBV6688335.1 site-specific integrase [Xanthomonas euvesicatoria pv. physalidis]
MDIYQPQIVQTVPLSARGQARNLLGSSAGLPTGFYFIIDRRTSVPISDVYDFLVAENVSLLGKPKLRHQSNTSKAHAEDLVDLLLFASAIKTPLAEFSEELLQQYADSMRQVQSPQTDRNYADRTIIKRVLTAKRLFYYLQQKGRLKNRFSTKKVLQRGTEKIAIAPDVQVPKTPATDALAKHIATELVDEISRYLGQMPSEKGEEPSRDRLLFAFLLNTGARISEALSIKCSDLPLKKVGKEDPLSNCHVSALAKGGNERKLVVPIWLLEELSIYIAGERANAIFASRANHDQVFVNNAAARSAGQPLTANNFRKTMRRAVVRAVGDAGSNSLPSPHACRHSYALWNFILAARAGNPDPAKKVQALLGHANKSTTEKTYLNASLLLEEALSETDQRHLMKALDEHLR